MSTGLAIIPRLSKNKKKNKKKKKGQKFRAETQRKKERNEERVMVLVVPLACETVKTKTDVSRRDAEKKERKK